MKVKELIERLQSYPPNARVILSQDLGASELEDGDISMAMMDYNEYAPYWEHHSPAYGWEYPSDYNRKTLFSEYVVIIS